MAHRATMRRLSQHAAALAAGGAALGAAATVVSNAAASAELGPSTFHPRWNDGWEAGRYSTAGTGFHRAEPNIHLVTYADKILPAGSAPGARVLVPLCGKTVDMPFMASRGVAVVGLEGASRAVREYFVDSASKPPSTKPIGKFQAHFTDDAPSLELWLGDLFDLEPGSAGKFSAVWDRASLVAIEPNLREKYVQTIKDCLSPGAKYLLSVVEHPPFPDGRLGPPYSIPESEVRRLYAEDFEIEVLPPIEVGEEVHSSGGTLGEHDYLLTLK